MVDIQNLINLAKKTHDAIQTNGVCSLEGRSRPEVHLQEWLFIREFPKESAVHEYRADTEFPHEFHVDVSGVRFFCISEREDIYG